MPDELLPFYNRELSFLRRLGAEFAQAHPKIAGRLRLGPDSSEDPHVERLIQGFAYLSARLRHKLDDDFPELTGALLSILYPHYQIPIPSMAVVHLDLDPGQNELTAGYSVPREMVLETEPIQGEPCRFRTCYPVTLWPIDLRGVGLSPPPFTAPATPSSSQAAAVLRLSLRCRASGLSFSALRLNSLRFFLKGQPQHVYPLYELLFNNVLEVALASSPGDPDPFLLDKGCIRPVGFERDQGMLPYPARSFIGYRLLTEFFVFPEKFLFFDLTGLDQRALSHIGNQLEFFIYLNRTSPDLERNITVDTFRLGCTPMVNLYRQRAEPIQLTHTDWEYRVVPDARRPLAHEVYSIDRVTASAPDGTEVAYQPFFSVKHAAQDNPPTTFWHATRRPGSPGGEQVDHGTELFLSLVDLNFQPSQAADWTVDVETTCLNRDLPHRLPFGGGQPRLQLWEGAAAVSRVTCLTAPTRTLRPAVKTGALWRLISHLSLNHLSLVDEDGGATALREVLKLYDFADSGETRSIISGVRSVQSRHVIGRVGPSGLGRGVEVTISFDEKRFTGSGLYLFACVLERFLALYCSVNSFSRLVATVEGRKEELRRWPPRMGEKILL
jgi:type VI secretion system protein ImpG